MIPTKTPTSWAARRDRGRFPAPAPTWPSLRATREDLDRQRHRERGGGGARPGPRSRRRSSRHRQCAGFGDHGVDGDVVRRRRARDRRAAGRTRRRPARRAAKAAAAGDRSSRRRSRAGDLAIERDAGNQRPSRSRRAQPGGSAGAARECPAKTRDDVARETATRGARASVPRVDARHRDRLAGGEGGAHERGVSHSLRKGSVTAPCARTKSGARAMRATMAADADARPPAAGVASASTCLRSAASLPATRRPRGDGVGTTVVGSMAPMLTHRGAGRRAGRRTGAGAGL